MTRRPVVHQFTATLAGRDAVGQHTLAVDRILREIGAETDIFAAHVNPEVRGVGRDYREHEDGPQPDLIIYQTSIGSPVADYVLDQPAPLVLHYHNMTPSEFFDPWEPAVAAELDTGRRQLARLARRAHAAVAVSEYNARDLRTIGYEDVVVAPVLFEGLFGEVGEVGGAGVAGGCGGSGAPSPGQATVTMLFVGRLAPNKCQQDLVGVLAALRGLGVDARLVLVGGVSSSGFVSAVEGLAAELGVSGSLVVAGSVSESELVGWYRAADVFVCASEHEGFCVPLVEAMGFGVPVVAFGAAAVPETVAGAGVVVGEKSVLGMALAVRRVVSDSVVREGLVAAGRRRAAELSAPVSTARMRTVLTDLLEPIRAGLDR